LISGTHPARPGRLDRWSRPLWPRPMATSPARWPTLVADGSIGWRLGWA